MNRPAGLFVDDRALEHLCQRYRVHRLAVFGSALRGELAPDSDLDILVEFEPGAAIGLRFITLQAELSKLFGRRVDLLTAGFLSPHLRLRVLEEAVPLYEAA
jgi:predicted nucleotidyltransferase